MLPSRMVLNGRNHGSSSNSSSSSSSNSNNRRNIDKLDMHRISKDFRVLKCRACSMAFGLQSRTNKRHSYCTLKCFTRINYKQYRHHHYSRSSRRSGADELGSTVSTGQPLKSMEDSETDGAIKKQKKSVQFKLPGKYVDMDVKQILPLPDPLPPDIPRASFMPFKLVKHGNQALLKDYQPNSDRLPKAKYFGKTPSPIVVKMSSSNSKSKKNFDEDSIVSSNLAKDKDFSSSTTINSRKQIKIKQHYERPNRYENDQSNRFPKDIRTSLLNQVKQIQKTFKDYQINQDYADEDYDYAEVPSIPLKPSKDINANIVRRQKNKSKSKSRIRARRKKDKNPVLPKLPAQPSKPPLVIAVQSGFKLKNPYLFRGQLKGKEKEVADIISTIRKARLEGLPPFDTESDERFRINYRRRKQFEAAMNAAMKAARTVENQGDDISITSMKHHHHRAEEKQQQPSIKSTKQNSNNNYRDSPIPRPRRRFNANRYPGPKESQHVPYEHLQPPQQPPLRLPLPPPPPPVPKPRLHLQLKNLNSNLDKINNNNNISTISSSNSNPKVNKTKLNVNNIKLSRIKDLYESARSKRSTIYPAKGGRDKSEWNNSTSTDPKSFC